MEHHLADGIVNDITTADLKEETIFCSQEEVKACNNDSETYFTNVDDHDYVSKTNLMRCEDSTTGLIKSVYCSHDEVKDMNNSGLGKSCINIVEKDYEDSEIVSKTNLRQLECAIIIRKEESVSCSHEEMKNNDNHRGLKNACINIGVNDCENSENVSMTNLGQFENAIIDVKEPIFSSQKEVEDANENLSITVDENDFSYSQSITEKGIIQSEVTTDGQNEAISTEEMYKFHNDMKSNTDSVFLECVTDSVIHNIEYGISKHVDKDSESNEADQLEIEAEDEGEISDGNFTNEIKTDDDDNVEINNKTVELKISKKNMQKIKQPSLCEEDKSTNDHSNDDIEEGEVKDDTISVAHCRFFARGHCMFGNICKNMHMTDKGLYKMFESDKKDNYVRSIRANNPRQEYVSLPLDAYVKNCLPPVESIEFRDLAWERGIRLAKQQQRQALERRNDPDFDEKYFYMNLKESPPAIKRKRRPSFEKHPSKLKCAKTRTSNHREKLQNMRNTTYDKKQHNVKSSEIHKRGNSQYENDVAKKRKFSHETEWRDPWRRSKSPTSKLRSHSRSVSSSDSCSSSCSSQCSCHSIKHDRGKDLSKKRISTKSNVLNDSKSKRSSHSKRCISPRYCSRSSSRSLSSTPTDVLKFREQVYRNKPKSSFESNSQQKFRYPDKSSEVAIRTSNINDYKPPVQKEIHKTLKSRKSASPNKTYRRSASQSSSCHSYESRSKSSCSSASYCSSNSCTSNYSRKSGFSSYTRETVKNSKYSFTLKGELNKRAILRSELNRRASLRKSKSMTKSPSPRKKAYPPELKSKESMPKLSFKFLPKSFEKSISSDVPKWLSNVEFENSGNKVNKLSNVNSSKQTMQKEKPMGLNVKKVSAKPVTGKSVNMLLRYQSLTKRNKEECENMEIVKSLNQTAKNRKQIAKNGNEKPKSIKKVDATKVPLSTPKAPCIDKSAQMLLQYHALTKKNNLETENNKGAQSLQTPKDVVQVKKNFNESKNIPHNDSKGKKAFKEPRKISEVPGKKEIHPLSSKNLNIAALSIKPQMSPSKTVQRSKSHIAMNLITDVSQHHNIRSGAKKSVIPPTISIAASKLNLKELGGSRRDLLLKQLKAVEAAIARKRSK